MNGKFDKLTSSYDNLVALLPNVLGKRLPIRLKKLGTVNLIGNSQITTTAITASFKMTSALGKVESDLVMENINFIDNATYLGNVVLGNFDIGTFLENKDLGKVTLNLDVDGKGFLKSTSILP